MSEPSFAIPNAIRNLYKYFYRFQLKAGMTRIVFFGFVILLVLYWKILPFAFTQDDFFILRQAWFNNFTDQLRTSLPSQDSIYFRPLGIQLYFWVTLRLFGLHPVLYRIIALVIHSLNAAMVFVLTEKLVKKKSWIVWFFYLTAPLHFTAIGWIGNISFVLVVFWILLTLLLWARSHAFIAVITFFIGLLTNEFATVAPVLLVLFSFFLNFKKLKRFAICLCMLFLIDLVYILYRLATPHAQTGDYEAGIGTHIFHNIRWLFLWTLGWAEPTKDYFTNIWHIRSEFIQTFPVETTVQAITTVFFLITLLVAVKNRRCLFGFMIFVISISPIIFFRQHVSPHYAMVGSIGVFLAIAIGLNKLPGYVTIVATVLWIAQIFSVMNIHAVAHWWVQHALLSASLQEKLRNTYSLLPNSKQIGVISKQPERSWVVLSGDNAAQLLYNNPEVKVVYQAEQ